MSGMFLDPFKPENTFSLMELVEAINLLPNNFGLIRNSGLFVEKGVRSEKIAIEMRSGRLTLLETMPRGAPPQHHTLDRSNMRPFMIPHIPVNSYIAPEDYANLRSFGTVSDKQTLAELYNEHLQGVRDDFAITEEFHLMGALKGVVYNANEDVILDLYDAFKVTRKEFYFDMLNSESDTDVPKICRDIHRYMELNAQGTGYSRIKVLVGEDFMDALKKHKSVREIYLGHEAAVRKFGGDSRKNFDVEGILFSEYLGQADNKAGKTFRFVEPDQGAGFPLGSKIYRTYLAPADFNETIGTKGRRYYTKFKPLDFDRGLLTHSQTNPLSLVTQPGLLFGCHAGASS